MFQTKIIEKIKTHVLCLFLENYALWGNVEKYFGAGQATDDSIIRSIHIEPWITKAANTNSQYVILIFFLLQQWLHERASMLCYSVLSVLFLKMWRELADIGILSLTEGDCQGCCHRVKTNEEAHCYNTAQMTIHKWVPLTTARRFVWLQMEETSSSCGR